MGDNMTNTSIILGAQRPQGLTPFSSSCRCTPQKTEPQTFETPLSADPSAVFQLDLPWEVKTRRLTLRDTEPPGFDVAPSRFFLQIDLDGSGSLTKQECPG